MPEEFTITKSDEEACNWLLDVLQELNGKVGRVADQSKEPHTSSQLWLIEAEVKATILLLRKYLAKASGRF